MKVLILGGGNSSEREVSLRSAKAVEQAVAKLEHEIVFCDPASHEDLAPFVAAADIVLPILHGRGGEDGTLQKQLDAFGKPYLGADARVSALCFDKVTSKQKMEELGYKTRASQTVDLNTFKESTLAKDAYVLKPIAEGSSIDTIIAHDPAAVTHEELIGVFSRHETMLLEELIDGIEITVPILGNTALPVVEIIPPDGEVFDYQNKYNGKTRELCPPAHITLEVQKQAQDIALTIHNKLGVRDLSRTDMICRNDDIYVLEINTMPGLTDQSLLPKSAAVAGYSMPDLVEKFIALCSSRA